MVTRSSPGTECHCEKELAKSLTERKGPALCPLPAALWAVSLAAHKGLMPAISTSAMCPSVSHHKMGGTNSSRADTLRAQHRTAPIANSTEACGWKWQGGFARKIPEEPQRPSPFQGDMSEKRANRCAFVVVFHQDTQQCCSSLECLEALPRLPLSSSSLHMSFFGVKACSCPRRIGASRISYF